MCNLNEVFDSNYAIHTKFKWAKYYFGRKQFVRFGKLKGRITKNPKHKCRGLFRVTSCCEL